MAELIIQKNNHTMCVNGEVNFTNAVKLMEQGLAHMAHATKITVDLSGLIKTDSSLLALLVAWFRAASKQNKQISVIHVPQFVKDVGRVCGVDRVIPLQ